MENYRNLTRISGAREVTSVLANSPLANHPNDVYCLQWQLKPFNVERLDFHFIMMAGALGGSSLFEVLMMSCLQKRT